MAESLARDEHQSCVIALKAATPGNVTVTWNRQSAIEGRGMNEGLDREGS